MSVDVSSLGTSVAFRHPFGSGTLWTETNGDSDGYFSAQDFGDKYFSNRSHKNVFHLGEDWNGDQGGNEDENTAVHVVSDGKVIFAGLPNDSGWAGVVVIAHRLSDGSYVTTLYGHLKTNADGTIYVEDGNSLFVGQDIEVGALIGSLAHGSEFSATETSHLHFEVRYFANADEVNSLAEQISDGSLFPFYSSQYTNQKVSEGYSQFPKPTNWYDPTDFLHSAQFVDSNDTFAGATLLLAPHVGLSGFVGGVDTSDFFSFVAPKNGILKATLSDLNADLDLQLLGGSQNLIKASEHGGTASDKVVANLIAGQTYYLRVDPYQAAISTYSLELDFISKKAITVLSISPLDASKSEGNSGPTSFAFTVARSDPLGFTSVDWIVSSIASPNADAFDFSGAWLPSGTVTFRPGEWSQIIEIDVQGDTQYESSGVAETFTVNLLNPTAGATLDPFNFSAQGVIQNDDRSGGPIFGEF